MAIRILSIFNSVVKTIIAINPTLQYPKPNIALKLHCVPNVPSFQHSNWGEVPILYKALNQIPQEKYFLAEKNACLPVLAFMLFVFFRGRLPYSIVR
jgi:hypothetical protein